MVQDIPSEVLATVFSNLDRKDLLKAQLVCIAWRRQLQRDWVWKRPFERKFDKVKQFSCISDGSYKSEFLVRTALTDRLSAPKKDLKQSLIEYRSHYQNSSIHPRTMYHAHTNRVWLFNCENAILYGINVSASTRAPIIHAQPPTSDEILPVSAFTITTNYAAVGSATGFAWIIPLAKAQKLTLTQYRIIPSSHFRASINELSIVYNERGEGLLVALASKAFSNHKLCIFSTDTGNCLYSFNPEVYFPILEPEIFHCKLIPKYQLTWLLDTSGYLVCLSNKKSKDGSICHLDRILSLYLYSVVCESSCSGHFLKYNNHLESLKRLYEQDWLLIDVHKGTLSTFVLLPFRFHQTFAIRIRMDLQSLRILDITKLTRDDPVSMWCLEPLNTDRSGESKALVGGSGRILAVASPASNHISLFNSRSLPSSDNRLFCQAEYKLEENNSITSLQISSTFLFAAKSNKSVHVYGLLNGQFICKVSMNSQCSSKSRPTTSTYGHSNRYSSLSLDLETNGLRGCHLLQGSTLQVWNFLDLKEKTKAPLKTKKSESSKHCLQEQMQEYIDILKDESEHHERQMQLRESLIPGNLDLTDDELLQYATLLSLEEDVNEPNQSNGEDLDFAIALSLEE